MQPVALNWLYISIETSCIKQQRREGRHDLYDYTIFIPDKTELTMQ